jgi:hypothetical protein
MRRAGRSLVALLFVGLVLAAAANAETGEAGGVEPAYGRISGRVVAEVEVLVCATNVETYSHYCYTTYVGSGYSIGGLPAGQYVVYFHVPSASDWEDQYYRNAATFAEATRVTVAAGIETHLEEALLRYKGEPVLTGEGLQKEAPPVPNPVQKPPGPVVFPTAPVAPSNLRTAPELVLPPARAISAGSLRLSVSCRFNACNGSIKLERRVTARDGHGVTEVLGWASFSLKRDVPSTIAIRLTPLGRKELMRAGHRPVSASIVASMQGMTVLTRSVHLT